jgi:predicted nuclease of restriction endonuclease-like (RecB) superfamily
MQNNKTHNNAPAQLDFYDAIRSIIQNARNRVSRTINTAMVETYWQIGRHIVEEEQRGEDRAKYGQFLIKNLAVRLTNEFGKGFSIANLKNIRQFYIVFTNDPKGYTLCSQLNWSHIRSLIRIEDPNARHWYMQETIEQNWSARALDRQISVLYYERLLSSRDPAPVKEEAEEKTAPLQTSAKNFLRDPYIFDFLNLPGQSIQETQVEQALIDNLQKFLMELGKGFAFVERQKRISTEDQDFYIDLIFYNFKLKCFLLIDLKIGKLNHQDVGQMDTYIRIFDQQIREADDNPTIGLILCSQKSEAVAKYSVLTDSKQMFASKYLQFLPSEEELCKELERERHLLIGKQ